MNSITPNSKWMTVKELSVFLGCSKGTIYNLASKSQIPYTKVLGLGLRFNFQDIENWLLKGGGEA